jgi:hypothetical protein
LVFLDEAHFGMTTNTAKTILNEINKLCGNAPKVFVTATYKKPLDVYNINKDEAKLTWDINDINIMKKIDTIKDSENEIKKRFGTIYDETLKNYSLPELKKIYSFFPEPYLITSVWDYKYLKQEKMKIGATDYGFDMEKLFTVNKDRNNDYTNEFSNRESVVNILRYYFGYPDKSQHYENQHIVRHRGILPRIKRICENRCRTMQMKNKPTTQLWFLPYGQQRPIKNVVNALLKIINGEDNMFNYVKNNYYFFVALDEKNSPKYDNVVYYNKSSKKSIKDQIIELEDNIKKGESIEQNNLIILAGARLQLGISLRNVDIVTLWNNISSTDAIFQMLFRSMTEVDSTECLEGEYCDNKKFGFMVDLNPQRALTNVFMFKDNLVDKETRNIDNQYKVIGDLINIDEDVFMDKYEGDESKKTEYIKDLFNKLYDSWGNSVDSMKKLTQKIIKFDQQILSTISSDLTGVNVSHDRGDKLNIDKPEGFDPGKKKEKKGKETKKTKKKQKNIELSELAAEVMSEYLSLLNIFTLYNEDSEMKCIIRNDINDVDKLEFTRNKLHEIVFSKESLKKTFLTILNTRLGRTDKNKFNEVFLNKLLSSITSNENKLSINKLIKTQKKKYYEYTIENLGPLLEYINQNLTPNEKERKEKGEIFTPMWLVNEMLDKLPTEVWTKSDYKWLDPAVGIGNFPIAIYSRLMDGLKMEYPNKEKRRKYILEEMLYMVDISDKNIFILKKIFCANKYELNIHKGSFLKQDCNYDFKFNVILGNPPYNPPKTETGSSGNSIWPHFVIKSFYIVKDNGFLLFVHPPGWKKPTNEIFNAEKLDILDGEYYKIDKKTNIRTGYKQIRQGLVWQVLRENGIFSFIYTNDQKNNKIGDKLYIPYFPAVDYYVYQKKGTRSICNTKNIFLGEMKESKEVRFNYDLNYLPNLITNQTQHILSKVTSKEGEKPEFKAGFDPRGFKNKEKGDIKYLYDANSKGPNYTNYSEEILNVNISKIVLNENGGIKGFYCKYIDKSEKIGVLHHTLLYEIDKIKGKNIEKFFNSDLVKFIFLITQYTSGKMETNEKLVANSITLPPIEESDYYKFFGIEKYQKFIEDTLTHFYGEKSTEAKVTKPDESKKTKKVSIAANNNASKKNQNNNVNHNGGSTKKKPMGKKSKKRIFN